MALLPIFAPLILSLSTEIRVKILNGKRRKIYFGTTYHELCLTSPEIGGFWILLEFSHPSFSLSKKFIIIISSSYILILK